MSLLVGVVPSACPCVGSFFIPARYSPVPWPSARGSPSSSRTCPTGPAAGRSAPRRRPPRTAAACSSTPPSRTAAESDEQKGKQRSANIWHEQKQNNFYPTHVRVCFSSSRFPVRTVSREFIWIWSFGGQLRGSGELPVSSICPSQNRQWLIKHSTMKWKLPAYILAGQFLTRATPLKVSLWTDRVYLGTEISSHVLPWNATQKTMLLRQCTPVLTQSRTSGIEW